MDGASACTARHTLPRTRGRAQQPPPPRNTRMRMPSQTAAAERKSAARPNIMHKSPLMVAPTPSLPTTTTTTVELDYTPSLTPFMSRRRVNSRASHWEGAAVVLLSQLIAVVSAPKTRSVDWRQGHVNGIACDMCTRAK